MTNINRILIDGESATATITGTTIIEICTQQNCSLQAVLAGGSTPTGTAKLQVSNDVPPSELVPFTPTNWFDLPNATVTFTDVGTKGTASIGISHHWLRAVWTPSSAAGATITITLHSNGQR